MKLFVDLFHWKAKAGLIVVTWTESGGVIEVHLS